MARLTAGKTYPSVSSQTNLDMVIRHALSNVQQQQEHVTRLMQESDDLNQRIRQGYRWLDSNSTFHPKYQRGLDLIAELQNQHNHTRWQLRDHKVKLMGHQVTFWQAWDQITPMEQEMIVAEHGDVTQIERPTEDSYRAWMESWGEMELEIA